MKNIHDELRDLSFRAQGRHDGADEALNWRRDLSKRQTLVFAWETELVHPKYMPEWVVIKDAKLDFEIPWNLRRWLEFREREWKRKTGRQILIQGQIYYSHTDTDPKLVKVPTQKNTRELFEIIVKTLPPTIDDWCEMYKKLFPTFMNDGIFVIDRTYGLTIMPFALEFIIAKFSSHATQRQNTMPTIKDIKSPIPEIEAYKNQFKKRLNRVALRHLPQEGNIFVSRKEFFDLLLAKIDGYGQEAEDEIAAEKSRLDEELQSAQQEESAS